MVFVDTSPSGLVISAIENDEKRALVDDLFMYFMNTRPGWVPSDAARSLAGMSIAELKAYRKSADDRCEADRNRTWG